MNRPFTEVEIRKSVIRLKNNKSTAMDDISAEMIKYSPKMYTNRLQTYLMKLAKTGNIPDDIYRGCASSTT